MLRTPILRLLWITAFLACAAVALAQPAATPDIQARLQKAVMLRLNGDDEQARKIYESLLPQLRSQAPSRQLTEALSNLGDIANGAGQYDRAVTLAHESLEVCRRLADIQCEAQAHNDAGLAYLNAGDYPASASELELALNLSRQTDDAQTSVIALDNLGNVHYYQAKYSEALRNYESAAQLVDKHSTEQWAGAQRKLTRLNLATLYQRLGNYQRAINIYHQELDSPHELHQREIAHVLANLGILYRRMGDSTEALKNYHDAEMWYAKQKDLDGELGVLKNIGIVLGLDLGRLQDALKTFNQALTLAEKTGNQRETMQALLYRGETLYRMQRYSDATKDFEMVRAYAVQLGTVEEEWKALYGLGTLSLQKGQSDLAEKYFRAAIQKIESVRSKLQLTRLKTDFLADKRDVYDSLIQLLLDRNDLAGALEYMERSRARVFQDRFFGGKITPASLSLASLQERLSPDTALIELWTGENTVAAIWLTRNSAGLAQKQLSSAEMEKLVRTVSGLPENMEHGWRATFGDISALLPQALLKFMHGDHSHLLIVPDGFLAMIPFELMMDASGLPLIEHHDVTYTPSAVLLLRGTLPRKRSFGLPWEQQLVAFGDPAVVCTGESSVLASRTGSDASLSALPSSGNEIRSIAAMSAGRAELYLKDADRKKDFFASARSGAPLLHVSTHAIADLDNPERSRLLFSPDEPGQPNNFLFLKELYDESLDLRGVSLATLSACDTERGRLVPGEGVQAFSRALLSAGSRSALTTLWRVPDQPTAEFMKDFYFYLLKKHASKAEALRLAKMDFFHSGTELSDPRFWGAFVLNGEGAEPVPSFISWRAVILWLLVLVSAAVLLVQFSRWRKSKRIWMQSKFANAQK